jgi:hypothetical protein
MKVPEQFGIIRRTDARTATGRFGWVDKYHKIVIPFDYQELPDPISHFNPAKMEGKYGAIDAKGKVIIPFKYSSLSPYYPQRIVVCREGPEKVSVFDFEGRVILPEEKRYNIWLFNDSILAVQDFNKKEIKTYDLQGRPLKSWPYSHILQFPSGRILAYRDTPDGSWLCTTQGLLDPDGRVLIPLNYSSMEWEKGDWARVADTKPKPAACFRSVRRPCTPTHTTKCFRRIPSETSHFWEGASWEQARAGLMDAQFKVIFPPMYLDIRFSGSTRAFTPCTPDATTAATCAVWAIKKDKW